MDWSLWPLGVLEVVLQQIDLPDRSRCALVCSSWAAAAASATRSIQIALSDPPQKIQGVMQWLGKHGDCVTQLELAGHGTVMKALPCPELRQLRLQGFKLQLEPWGREPGILQATKDLIQLVLQRVTVLPARGSAQQQLMVLSALSGLQHLELCELQDQLSLQYASLPGVTLQHLVQLTHLHIEGGLSDAALQHLSCLTSLQQLRLQRLGADTTPAALEALRALQKLTCLLIEGAHFTLGDVSTPSLAGLTGLQSIQLHSCDALEPALLSNLTALQELQLKLTPMEGGEDGTVALLTALPKLHQLTALQLTAALTRAAPAAAAYSALTTSSQLKELWLSQATLGPTAAWLCIFPLQGQQLTHLTALHLSYCAPKMGAAAMLGLANSCPCLQRLTLYDMTSSIRYTDDVTIAVQNLPQLTELRMTHVGDFEANCVLAQLTGLSSLVIAQPSSISDRGVLGLTALRQLTYLSVSSEGISREVAGNTTRTLQLVKQQLGDCNVSVHKQLCDRCLAWRLQPFGISDKDA